MNLLEWTSAFIDYMNSFKRDITNKKVEKNIIICKHSEKGTIKYIIEETLTQAVFEKFEGKIVLITLNSKHNLKFLVENWQKFSENNSLKIIFVNPKLNLQWSIVPYLHHKFADPDSLKTGIESLFSSVPEI